MENTELWLIIAAVGVFVGGVIVYLVFMVFFPEWVGITGKKAIEAERSHQEGAEANNDDLTERMQRTNKPQS